MLFIKFINISLWPAVVKDIEETLGYVHINWDTNGEKVTLEFIHKEKEIHIEKKLNMSAKWLEDISKKDTITFKVYYIILFGNVHYCYGMCTIIFRLLLQLNWREKEEMVTVLMVYIMVVLVAYPLDVYCDSLIVCVTKLHF